MARGLPVFGNYLCQNPPPYPRLRADDPNLEPEVRTIVERFVFTDRGPQAPPCREQAPLGRLVGQSGRYPRLQPIGE